MNFYENFNTKEYAPDADWRKLNLVEEKKIEPLKDLQSIKIAKSRLDTVLIKLHSEISGLMPDDVDKLRKERDMLLATLKASNEDVSRYNIS